MVCLAGFAAQMSPNSNQLTFIEQVATYHKTVPDLLNSVAAALAGWVAGPFFIIPLVAVIGRSAVIFWSLIGILATQIWAAKMTGPDDYISFTLSRLFCGLFGGIPAILGSGYIIDMYYLHQRGKGFAVFEVLIIFAVVGGGTLSGFVAHTQPWQYVFWWTLGPVCAAIAGVVLFVEDTTYNRDPNTPSRAPMPKSWIANRVATFVPGTATQLKGTKGREFVSCDQSQVVVKPASYSNTVSNHQNFRSNAPSFRSRSPSPRLAYLWGPTSLYLWACRSCKRQPWPLTSCHRSRLVDMGSLRSS